MSKKNINTINTTTPKNLSAVTGDYKEFLYELLEDPELQEEYLAASSKDPDFPEGRDIAEKNIAEAKRRNSEKSKEKAAVTKSDNTEKKVKETVEVAFIYYTPKEMPDRYFYGIGGAPKVLAAIAYGICNGTNEATHILFDELDRFNLRFHIPHFYTKERGFWVLPPALWGCLYQAFSLAGIDIIASAFEPEKDPVSYLLTSGYQGTLLTCHKHHKASAKWWITEIEYGIAEREKSIENIDQTLVELEQLYRASGKIDEAEKTREEREATKVKNLADLEESRGRLVKLKIWYAQIEAGLISTEEVPDEWDELEDQINKWNKPK